MTQATPTRLKLDVEVQRDGFLLDVALEVGNEVMVLFGPSGAGKSTTLNTIAGTLTPRAGEITLDGEILFRSRHAGPKTNLPPRARRVGYVFQNYALFPHLTALGNIAYPLWRQDGADHRARELLERMGLGDMGNRYPHELSGGQQQRVAIARALAAEPRVLLLDEPFAALDMETRRSVRGEIRKLLQEVHMPVILVTHAREETMAMGDRVAIIDRGRIAAEGQPLSLLGHPPRERVARLLGVENILRLKVLQVDLAEGVVRCGPEEQPLEVPLSEARTGDEITIGIRADDVLLASVSPEGISARNIIPGTVVSVQPHGAVYEVMVDCRFPLVSHITHRAVEELGIRPGTRVWAVAKASACFILRE